MCSIQKGVIILAIFLSLQRIVNGECENVPHVPESSNNATESRSFDNGSTIAFTCNPGYKGVGSTYFYCRGSEWAGNFSCLRVCPEIRMPKNGLIVRKTVYGETTELEFACRDGYTLFGYSSMFCWADGSWSSDAPPTCDPVSCGDFGSVPNGEVFQNNLDVVLNNFGSEVRISCNEGYNLIGSPTVTCKSDGTWSPRPECEASLCGTHPGTKSHCIYDCSTSDNGVLLSSSTGNNHHVVLLSLLCRDNSVNVSVTEVGTGTAFCENNKWDNLDMGCFCDCLVDVDNEEGISYNNLFNKKFVKHGDQLNWDCKKGYRKQGSTNISCYDGLMEKPLCVRKKELNEKKEYVTVIVSVLSGIIVVSVFVIFIIIKKRCFNEKKGRGVDEERSVTDRLGGTNKHLLAKLSKKSPETIELATAPFIDQPARVQCGTETLIIQSIRSQSDMTQVSRDQRDIEKPSTQASSYKIDAETPTTQAPSDKIDAETPTTQAPSDKIDAETPTSPTHPRLTRIDQRKRDKDHRSLTQNIRNSRRRKRI